MNCLLQCNVLSGDDYEYAMSTWMRRVDHQSAVNLYLRVFSNSWQVIPLFRNVIITNMQLHPICLHTNLSCVPIPAKKKGPAVSIDIPMDTQVRR